MPALAWDWNGWWSGSVNYIMFVNPFHFPGGMVACCHKVMDKMNDLLDTNMKFISFANAKYDLDFVQCLAICPMV